MIAAIAWRNLWRNKLRSSVIIAAITIGITGGVVTDGFMTGLVDQRVNSAIANEVSNIQMHNPKFLLNDEIKYLLPDATRIKNEIGNRPMVQGVSLRLECQAMAASANAGAGVIVYGVVPADEQKVSDIYKHLVEGVYLNNKQRIPAVIGRKLAKKLDIGIDDKVIITLSDTSGTIISGAFRVVGIYKTSNDIFDEANIFVRKNDLATLIGFRSNDTHEIAVRLNENRQTTKMMQIFEQKFSKQLKAKKLKIQSWESLEPILKSMITMMNFFSYIFMIIILVALAFAIINTMLMAIMERTREIGMLMALGMNKQKIFILIMLETVFLSVAGAIVGLLISVPIIRYYALNGFDLSSVSNGLNSIGYSSIIYFRVNAGFYFGTIVMVIILAVLSSISPAIKALKLQPTTAIRNNQ